MNKDNFIYLGKSGYSDETIQLDTFPAPSVGRVTFQGDELTSFCPVTGQPDFYQFKIEYAPDKLCIESKSLKLYITGFRDKQMFAETMCQEMAAYLQSMIYAKWIKVSLTQQVRGGITLSVEKEITNESNNNN